LRHLVEGQGEVMFDNRYLARLWQQSIKISPPTGRIVA
jgi:hypothetical protein